MGKKPIKEVTVLRCKPPPKQEKHVSLVENDAKGLGSKLNFEGVSDESFQKAGTGKSVLDSLPNDVLQDVLLQYWHANHESKSTRASAANGAKEQPAPVAADLWSLSIQISKWLRSHTQADKINVAALGNVVSQFHLHVVARHRSDPAWPAPIWGQGTMEPLEQTERNRRLTALQLWYKQSSGTI